MRIHKLNELLRIIAKLGARSVSVTVKSGRRLSGSIGFGASKGASAQVSGKASAARSDDVLFSETYIPEARPAVPNDVVWLPREPEWQHFVDRRLSSRVKKQEFRLRYEESFGLDAKLKVGVSKLGVNIGGSYEEFESTEWHVKADWD